MKLTCTNCQTSYQIADEKVPAGGARATCANCGQAIIVPGAGDDKKGSSLLSESSSIDYGQTMAYDFAEVDQSQTEISALLERISDREPFISDDSAPVLREVHTGTEYRIHGAQVTVGRSGTDITVDDPEVSRNHCLIKVFGDRIVIMDLNSTNGTYVDGKKVMTASLGISEHFSIGNTVFELAFEKAD
jgi:predicted Zn finger-like uncharacterized protein